MTTVDDDYGADVEELGLFGPPPATTHLTSTAAGVADEAPPAAAAPPRKKPGPPPNPNSKRQQKIRRARPLGSPAPPPRKVKPNAPAPANQSDVYRAGGLAVVGWVAKPLAALGLGMQITASVTRDERKRQRLGFHGAAFSLDSLALEMRAEQFSAGLAAIAPHVPWAARVLDSAARISPFSELAEATMGLIFQALVNHGVMPPMASLGTMAPEELAAAAGVPMDDEG
jgi:hypothetical protein